MQMQTAECWVQLIITTKTVVLQKIPMERNERVKVLLLAQLKLPLQTGWR